jgi:hypothetical protein
MKQYFIIILHLITAFENAEHERITRLKKIPFNDKNVTVSVTQLFNILFVEIPNQYYYLSVLQEIYLYLRNIFIQQSHKNNVVHLSLNLTLEHEYLR